MLHVPHFDIGGGDVTPSDWEEGITPTGEEESLVAAVHSCLLNLIKTGSTEKVQLMAINLALQFLRDLDLESGSDAYDDKDEEDTF